VNDFAQRKAPGEISCNPWMESSSLEAWAFSLL